jgi:hypothetical protein
MFTSSCFFKNSAKHYVLKHLQLAFLPQAEKLSNANRKQQVTSELCRLQCNIFFLCLGDRKMGNFKLEVRESRYLFCS